MKKRISWGLKFRGTCLETAADYGPYTITEAETKFFNGSSISSEIFELQKFAEQKSMPDFCPIEVNGVLKVTGEHIEIILEAYKIKRENDKRMLDLLGWDYNESESMGFHLALKEAIEKYSSKE